MTAPTAAHKDTLIQVRAHVVRGGGGDYHDQEGEHWITGRISTPMSRYPDFRESRTSFGINVLGTVVVEVETTSEVVGVGVSTGGEPACWIIENHLARFVEGSRASEVERIWDQMYSATLFYGRKGLVLNAISAVDIAIWDLLGKLRDEPVYALLGGPVRDELTMYATGPRPDLAKQMGFVGGKMPLRYGPADGEDGLHVNVETMRDMRERVGDDFLLAYDCWMSLDVQYALRLMQALEPTGLSWLEEPLSPDDYWGHASLYDRKPASIALTTGEHEATRWGFRALLEIGRCDVIQPDVNWCGGITELIKISALAESRGVKVIPHGSGVYSYHFVITRTQSPITEFIMVSPAADRVAGQFDPLLTGEPVPENGRLRLPDRPGFGVDLNPEIALERPYTR